MLGIVVPKCRLNASGSSVDGPGRPLFRLLKFEWKRRVLIRQSSFQKAQRAVLRNQLCIKVALFRACAAGEPLPTSERSLPVPWGWAIGQTFASLAHERSQKTTQINKHRNIAMHS